MATPKPELQEIASTLDGRDITRGWVSPLQLELPDDSVLMTRGGSDYALYREVLRDDHVKAALTQRIHAVLSRPWEVRPGGDKRIDKQAARFLEEQLQALRFDAITEKMLYGVFYGFAVAEVLWAMDGGRVVIDDIKVRDRRRFGFDGAGRLRLKTLSQPQGELLPERKFWTFTTGADHDDAPYGLGLAHWLYWPVWLKRNGIKFWAVALEKFGSPTALGKFPPGTTAEDQAKLLQALQAIQRDAAIIFPEGMSAELLEAQHGGSVEHGAFTSIMNAAILVITIGQTASTQGTPGKLGNDETQNDVRLDIVRADADLLCMSFNNSVAKWLTEYNFPGAQPPQVWRVLDDPDDQDALAERDLRLSQVGYRPSLERVTEVYGEGYEPIAPAAPPAPDAVPGVAQPPEPPVAPAFAAGQDPTAVDRQSARLADEAAPALEAMLASVRRLVDEADSLEALRDRLLAAYGDLDTTRLTAVMQMAYAAADLAGRYDVDRESRAQTRAD